MSFSSYIACGLQSIDVFGDEGSDDSSHISIMDYFQDFPLCCQDTDGVEAIFRDTVIDLEEPSYSDREGITRSNKITEKPWRPPLYRDKSLLAAPRDMDEESQSPTSSSKILTPSVGVVSCDDSIPSRQHDSSPPRSINKNDEVDYLPPAFVPPKNSFYRPTVFEFEAFNRQDHVDQPDPCVDDGSILLQSSPTTSTNLTLGPTDVVCGRGAPTSIHPGNLAFKKTIKKQEMKYLCSTRSEKPKIATRMLEEFSARGVRFIKRERTDDEGFVWMEIGEQRAYEKICQSLREGAPQLRRQMMAIEAKGKQTKKDEKHRYSKPRNHHSQQQRQQRQDLDTGFSGETTRIVCDGSQTHASSFSTVQTTNVNPYNPVEGQRHRNIELLYYDDHGSKDHLYDVGKHHDAPYYVHLPPQLGGEILFSNGIY